MFEFIISLILICGAFFAIHTIACEIERNEKKRKSN
jgi:hypothetical protein